MNNFNVNTRDPRPGQVRALRTGEGVLITRVTPNYVEVVPAIVDSKRKVGRHLNFKGVQFFLDFPTKISKVLIGDWIGTIPLSLNPQIGRDAPKEFAGLRERFHVLSYVDTEDDIARLLRAA